MHAAIIVLLSIAGADQSSSEAEDTQRAREQLEAATFEASVDRGALPKKAENWTRIGLYKLKDGENERSILIYVYDSDFSGEEGVWKRERNVLSVHAVYRDGTDQWKRQEMFSYVRVRFTKVANVASDHLSLECRPNFIVHIEPGEDLNKGMERVKEINKPFIKRVSFVEGVLTAK